MAHTYDLTVYYDATDAGGVVYHANYITFCERARTEFLHSLGFSNTGLVNDLGVYIIVRHLTADFIKPARLEDRLAIVTEVIDLGQVSLRCLQKVYRCGDQLFTQNVKLACINKDGKPVVWPEALKRAFASEQEQNLEG